MAAAQSLDLKVFASNVVRLVDASVFTEGSPTAHKARASENLLGVAAELKELLVLSDFERLEAADRAHLTALELRTAEARRGLEAVDQRLQSHNHRLETVLAAVPVPLPTSTPPEVS